MYKTRPKSKLYKQRYMSMVWNNEFIIWPLKCLCVVFSNYSFGWNMWNDRYCIIILLLCVLSFIFDCLITYNFANRFLYSILFVLWFKIYSMPFNDTSNVSMIIMSSCRDRLTLAVLNLRERGRLQSLKKKWWDERSECGDDATVLVSHIRFY